MTYVLGCDVSFWQDNNSTPQQINFHAMRQAGARRLEKFKTPGAGCMMELARRNYGRQNSIQS